MKWNKKFDYPSSIRSLVMGQRHYEIGTDKLPSVTTILSQTQSKEKKAKLSEWQQKVGKIEADKIRDNAAERGSIMHRIIESMLLDEKHADLSDVGMQAGKMAQIIFNDGLRGCMDEIWGTEMTLYYPGLYAGATDLAGIYEGVESIVDFKQSNKPKRREWIEDYFLQLAGYAVAHNYVYKTNIQQGVVLMCTKDNLFQKFKVQGSEFQNYMWKWLQRVSEYYKNQGKGDLIQSSGISHI